MAAKPTPAAGSPAEPWRKDDLLLLGLFFVAALALRLCLRTPESIWLDEANSVLIAGRAPTQILKALMGDGNPPLYYFLLHGWLALFGGGESGLRTFSALLGAFLPAAVFWTARLRLSRRAAMISSGLALFWPLHVYYSQQVRMYALLPTFSVLFLGALLRAMDHQGAWQLSWKPWAAVVIAGAALVYTHNYGAFVVLAAPLIWLSSGPRSRSTLLHLAVALGLVLLIYLPWLRVVLRQAQTDVGSWIAYSFRAAAPLQSLDAFGTCVQLPPLGGLSPPFPPGWAPSTLWFLLVLSGSLIWSWKVPADRGLVFGFGSLLLIPILVPYAASLLWKPVYYAGRYEIVAYPGFALLAGMGADRFLGTSASRGKQGRTRLRTWTAALLLGLYLGLSGFVLMNFIRRQPDRAEDRIAASLSRWLSAGDTVILTGLGRAPVEYYLDRRGWGDRLHLISFPRATEAHLGWYDFSAVRRSGSELEEEARALVDSLVGSPQKVFLVDNADFPELRTLQEPLRRCLLARSSRHQILLRTGPNPAAAPVYEVSVYTFGS